MVVVLAEVDGVVAEKAAGVEEVDEVAALAAVVRRLLFSKRGKGNHEYNIAFQSIHKLLIVRNFS